MATPEDARRANRSLLLGTLHRAGSRSRADLAKATGLTRATVSAVVRELLADGLVEELGLDPASGVGKPATLVGIDTDGRHIVCLDLSEPDQVVGALVDLGGKVVLRRTFDRRGALGPAALDLVTAIVGELVTAAERPLLGVGIASPGIIDPDGVVVTAAHLDWRDVALRAHLHRALGVPVAVINDANAAALAELTFGEGTATNLIYVRIDEGVGAGLVLDGRLFTGSSAAAGEIGHVVVDPAGAMCACGKRGCVETEVSEILLHQRLAAVDGDGHAVLDRAGEHLGIALATVVSALDVTDIVLSGSDPVTTETFRNAAARAIAARTLPVIADRLVVRPSSFAFDDAVIGAAARVLDLELGIR